MIDILRVVKQTNNTILFEKFNEDEIDLTTLLNNERDNESLNDDKLAEIYDKLAVRSFEEFLDRFTPTLYLSFDEQQNPVYSTKNPGYEGMIQQKLNLDNKIFDTLVSIIDSKGESGATNIDFSYKDVLDFISPKSAVEGAEKLRKNLQYNEEEYNKLERENPKRKEYVSEIKKIRKKIVELYRDDPTALIPLAIEDARKKIEFVSDSDENNEGTSRVKILGYPRFSESSGALEIIPFKENEADNVTTPALESKAAQWVENDLEKHLPVQQNNSFTKNLVVSTFSKKNLPSNAVEIDQLKSNHDAMLSFYNKKINSFMDIAKPIIQSLLGVKVFFDQTQSDEKPTLIIANNSAKELFQEKELVNKFIESASKDLSKKIWLAILPNVTYHEESIGLDEIDDLDEAIDLDKSQDSYEDETTNSPTFVKPLLKMLAERKVHTFFNFQPSKETNINALHTQGIKPLMEKVSEFEPSPYSVFSMPNITVLPDDKSLVELGKMFGENKESVNSVLNGVYIDASYATAGLVAGWLNPRELKYREFKNVLLNTPGVRFDIEKGDNNIEFTSSIGVESTKSYPDALLTSLNEKGFGFVLSSDYIIKDGKKVNNLFVYHARSLYEKEGKYQPIYKKLVIDTLEVYLRHTTGGKLDKIKEFMKKDVRELSDEENMNMVNAFLQQGDSIELLEDHTINFNFAGMSEVVDIDIKEN